MSSESPERPSDKRPSSSLRITPKSAVGLLVLVSAAACLSRVTSRESALFRAPQVEAPHNSQEQIAHNKRPEHWAHSALAEELEAEQASGSNRTRDGAILLAANEPVEGVVNRATGNASDWFKFDATSPGQLELGCRVRATARGAQPEKEEKPNATEVQVFMPDGSLRSCVESERVTIASVPTTLFIRVLARSGGRSTEGHYVLTPHWSEEIASPTAVTETQAIAGEGDTRLLGASGVGVGENFVPEGAVETSGGAATVPTGTDGVGKNGGEALVLRFHKNVLTINLGSDEGVALGQRGLFRAVDNSVHEFEIERVLRRSANARLKSNVALSLEDLNRPVRLLGTH